MITQFVTENSLLFFRRGIPFTASRKSNCWVTRTDSESVCWRNGFSECRSTQLALRISPLRRMCWHEGSDSSRDCSVDPKEVVGWSSGDWPAFRSEHSDVERVLLTKSRSVSGPLARPLSLYTTGHSPAKSTYGDGMNRQKFVKNTKNDLTKTITDHSSMLIRANLIRWNPGCFFSLTREMYCVVPLHSVTFCIHSGIIPVGQFSRKCAKLIKRRLSL